jgi:hypothetical protein
MAEVTVKEKLRDILAEINYGQLCMQYFHKSPTWLYNKINRNIVNGKPSDFSQEELAMLKEALCNLSDRIKRVADTL